MRTLIIIAIILSISHYGKGQIYSTYVIQGKKMATGTLLVSENDKHLLDVIHRDTIFAINYQLPFKPSKIHNIAESEFGRNILKEGRAQFDNLIQDSTNVFIDYFQALGVPLKINLENCIILNKVDLLGCKIQDISIGKSTFKADIFFTKTHFLKDANFNDVNFNKQVNFSNVEFHESTFFKNVKFSKSTVFEKAKFASVAYFTNCEFIDPNSLNKCSLPDTLILSGIKLSFDKREYLNLRDTKYTRNLTKDNKCYVHLDDVASDQILLPYSAFQISNLTSKKDTLSIDKVIKIYEGLINTSANAGLLNDAVNWDIDMKKYVNRVRYGVLGEIANTFNKYWWNFGHDREYILLIWLPFFFLMFFLINFYALDWINTVYTDKELGSGHSISLGKKGVSNRLTYAFFVTAIIYFGFRVEHKAINFQKTFGVLYIYFIYVIGVVHLAFSFSYIINSK